MQPDMTKRHGWRARGDYTKTRELGCDLLDAFLVRINISARTTHSMAKAKINASDPYPSGESVNPSV